MNRKSIFLNKDEDEHPFDGRAYADMVGYFLANSLKTRNKEFIKGEVYIFVGTRDKNGKRGIISIPGTNANSKFKEKVSETAMDILLQDAGVDYFKPENDIT
jgi:hypothetical protein